MADMPPLTPQDYDPWRLATPLQLLTLLERLGTAMTEVARWLHVPKSSVSMWRHGTRAFPPKHLPTLLERTRRTLDAQADLTRKAVSLAPTEALRRALHDEFEVLYARWKSEVLSDAGILRRQLQQQAEAFVQEIARQPLRADVLEHLDLVWGTMRQHVALLMALEGVTPDPEQTWDARMTVAHEAAHPSRPSRTPRARRGNGPGGPEPLPSTMCRAEHTDFFDEVPL